MIKIVGDHMALKIVVATNNPHKLHEMMALFHDVPVELVTMNDVNIHIHVNETGKTFSENALLKAGAAAKLTSLPVIADDSGLEVKALGEFPGIYSARFMEESTYKEKNAEIIRMLGKYPDKTARFKCVIALYNLSQNPLVFTGIVNGHIDTEPRGENGFGYDPIFISDEIKKSFGLASEEEKNRVSHRGKAARQVIEYLKTNKLI
jgi:XTP/dITP diphosphohydrolase